MRVTILPLCAIIFSVALFASTMADATLTASSLPDQPLRQVQQNSVPAASNDKKFKHTIRLKADGPLYGNPHAEANSKLKPVTNYLIEGIEFKIAPNTKAAS